MVRVIYVVHESEGRLRMRLPYLRRVPEQAEPLAERLSGVEGVEEVQIRPFTGSILCLHDPERLPVAALVAEVRRATSAREVLRRGERSEIEEDELARAARESGPEVARALAGYWKSLNFEVLRATEGRIDLGTIAALGFAAAGAAQVVSSRQLPIPPWFNLAWWAFRTFSTLEQPAIEHAASEPQHAPEPERAPEPRHA